MAFSPRYFSTFREASECTSATADSAVAAAATVATTAVQGPKKRLKAVFAQIVLSEQGRHNRSDAGFNFSYLIEILCSFEILIEYHSNIRIFLN